MIIKNVPSEFWLQIHFEEPMCVFSDDSRFIYKILGWYNSGSISVYDIIYNKYITLLPDTNATELLSNHENIVASSLIPNVQILDSSTLLFLYNDNALDDGTALLTVTKLKFSDCTYSVFDSKLIRDCYSFGKLVKDGNRGLIIHTFAVDVEEYVSNDEFLGYYSFLIDDNQKIQLQENRIVFDFDLPNSGFSGTWHLCNNKLWCIKETRHSADYEFVCFNLNESKPKAEVIEIFDRINYAYMFQWSGNVLIKYFSQIKPTNINYRLYDNEGLFTVLDLNTLKWSNIYQRRNIPNLEGNFSQIEKNLKLLYRADAFGFFYFNWPRHFDSNFNVFILEKVKKRISILPFRTPLKLRDIAWYSVLNNGLLDVLKKENITIYPPLF